MKYVQYSSVYRFSQLQYLYTHVLVSSFSHVLILCPSVPWWNHQKHPRGGGDDNPWPLVLSAGCHRIGYEGTRDPHRISERGKHVTLHLSNSLINQSHSVSWKYVDCFLSSSSFLKGCYLHFLGGKTTTGCVSSFAFFIILFCCSLCCCCMPSLLCWSNNSKLLEISSCLD